MITIKTIRGQFGVDLELVVTVKKMAGRLSRAICASEALCCEPRPILMIGSPVESGMGEIDDCC